MVFIVTQELLSLKFTDSSLLCDCRKIYKKELCVVVNILYLILLQNNAFCKCIFKAFLSVLIINANIFYDSIPGKVGRLLCSSLNIDHIGH